MTVSRLRKELTDEELAYYSAYYELKSDRERESLERSKRQM